MHQREHDGSGDPVRYTVRPGLATEVPVMTRPYGCCTLQVEGAAQEHDLLVFADSDGVARVHVRPAGESPELIELTLRCSVDGDISHHRIELRASTHATDDLPFAHLAAGRERKAGRRRPGLSEDDALRLPDGELLERGYPPRPDRDDAPGAFRLWRRSVMAPAVAIEPRMVARPDIGAGLARVQATEETSSNWSGYELRAPSHQGKVGPVRQFGPYDTVMAEWRVPHVTGGPFLTRFSALWVGLDGDSLQDLWQAGTEQDAVAFLPYLPHRTPVWLAAYSAWTEMVPQQPREQVVSDLPVRGGDEVVAIAWIGDEGKDPSLDGKSGFAYVHNVTSGQVKLPDPTRRDTSKTPKISGAEAEWIMEAPTDVDTKQVLPLSHYSSATMEHCFARQATQPAGFGYVACQDDPNIRLTMMAADGATVISKAIALDETTIRFENGDPRFGPFHQP